MLRGTTAAKRLSRRRLAAMNSPTRKWRNWQTRRIQDATSCPTVAATPASSFDLRSAATGPGRSRGYVQGTTGHDAESVERDSSLGVGLGLVLIARQRARNGGQGRRYWTGKLIRLQLRPWVAESATAICIRATS